MSKSINFDIEFDEGSVNDKGDKLSYLLTGLLSENIIDKVVNLSKAKLLLDQSKLLNIDIDNNNNNNNNNNDLSNILRDLWKSNIQSIGSIPISTKSSSSSSSSSSLSSSSSSILHDTTTTNTTTDITKPLPYNDDITTKLNSPCPMIPLIQGKEGKPSNRMIKPYLPSFQKELTTTEILGDNTFGITISYQFKQNNSDNNNNNNNNNEQATEHVNLWKKTKSINNNSNSNIELNTSTSSSVDLNNNNYPRFGNVNDYSLLLYKGLPIQGSPVVVFIRCANNSDINERNDSNNYNNSRYDLSSSNNNNSNGIWKKGRVIQIIRSKPSPEGVLATDGKLLVRFRNGDENLFDWPHNDIRIDYIPKSNQISRSIISDIDNDITELDCSSNPNDSNNINNNDNNINNNNNELVLKQDSNNINKIDKANKELEESIDVATMSLINNLKSNHSLTEGMRALQNDSDDDSDDDTGNSGGRLGFNLDSMEFGDFNKIEENLTDKIAIQNINKLIESDNNDENNYTISEPSLTNINQLNEKDNNSNYELNNVADNEELVNGKEYMDEIQDYFEKLKNKTKFVIGNSIDRDKTSRIICDFNLADEDDPTIPFGEPDAFIIGRCLSVSII
jgi:hypothetical protein